jgi:hypothetical protein
MGCCVVSRVVLVCVCFVYNTQHLYLVKVFSKEVTGTEGDRGLKP